MNTNKREQNILVVDMGSEYVDEICESLDEVMGVSYRKLRYDYPMMYRLFQHDLPNFDKLIISGSKRNVFEPDRPDLPLESLVSTPVLAICYGSQLVADRYGIEMEQCNGEEGELGDSELEIVNDSILFTDVDLKEDNIIHQWHWWRLKELPEGFKLTSKTEFSPIGSFEKDNVFCLQWHPEMTKLGRKVIKNFLKLID